MAITLEKYILTRGSGTQHRAPYACHLSWGWLDHLEYGILNESQCLVQTIPEQYAWWHGLQVSLFY